VILHDFRCAKCGFTFEVAFPSSLDFKREIPCRNCEGVAVQIWLRAPGLAGVEEPGTRGISRSFQPGYDVQSGRHFNTRADRDRYVKERGLVLMGPQEWDRTRKAMPERPEPDHATLPEAMEKSWQEMKAGKKAPPVQHLDPNIPTMEAKDDA